MPSISELLKLFPTSPGTAESASVFSCEGRARRNTAIQRAAVGLTYSLAGRLSPTKTLTGSKQRQTSQGKSPKTSKRKKVDELASSTKRAKTSAAKSGNKATISRSKTSSYAASAKIIKSNSNPKSAQKTPKTPRTPRTPRTPKAPNTQKSSNTKKAPKTEKTPKKTPKTEKTPKIQTLKTPKTQTTQKTPKTPSNRSNSKRPSQESKSKSSKQKQQDLALPKPIASVPTLPDFMNLGSLDKQPLAPPRKRTYVQAGIYAKNSSQAPVLSASPTASASGCMSCPMPLPQCVCCLDTQKDFQLPYELSYSMERDAVIQGLRDTGLRGSKVQAMQEFTALKKNVYIHRKERVPEPDEIPVCDCLSQHLAEGELGCTEHCHNAMMFQECSAQHCPMGANCNNQRFQKRQYGNVTVKDCGPGKGWGLFTKEDISKGQFIWEYLGEVIDEETYVARQEEYRNEKHKYFMTLGHGEIIDASRKAGFGRFCNHSCAPNCETQKWTVNGELCVGIFAIEDIPLDNEITIDYQFERYGEEKQPCYCGASTCRKFLGRSKEDREKERLLKPPKRSSSDSPASARRKRLASGLDPVDEEAVGVRMGRARHQAIETRVWRLGRGGISKMPHRSCFLRRNIRVSPLFGSIGMAEDRKWSRPTSKEATKEAEQEEKSKNISALLDHIAKFHAESDSGGMSDVFGSSSNSD